MRSVQLEGLDRVAHDAMLESIASFSDRLERVTYEHSDGHPLLTMHLVREWSRRGRLTRTPREICIDIERAMIPRTLTGLWSRRLTEMYSGLTRRRRRDARVVLEIAAAFGQTVPVADWLELAEGLGLDIDESLLEMFVRRGLAEWERNTWRFPHDTLVGVLEQQSRRAGRWEQIHAEISDWLASRTAEGSKTELYRLAGHRRAANRVEAALETYLDICRIASRQHDRRTLGRALDAHAEVLEKTADSLRLRHRMLQRAHRIFWHLLRGEGATALSEFFAVEPGLDGGTEPDEYGALLISGARALRHSGRADLCLEYLEEAKKQFRNVEHRRGVARSRYQIGLTVAYEWQLGRAAAELRAAARDFDAVDAPVSASRAYRWLATVYLFTGRFERARSLARDVLEDARSLGAAVLEARVENTLGEIARYCGDWDDARKHYRRAIDLWSSYGEVSPIYRFNACMVELGAGAYDVAERLLDEVSEELEHRPFDASGWKRCATRLGIAAGRGNWENWERRIDEGETRSATLIERSVVDLDDLWLAELVADIAPPRRRRAVARFASSIRNAIDWPYEPGGAPRTRTQHGGRPPTGAS